MVASRTILALAVFSFGACALRLDNDDKYDFVLLYTMSNVGDASVRDGLHSKHVSSIKALYSVSDDGREPKLVFTPPERVKTRDHETAKHLIQNLPKSGFKKPLVITLVRNPFQRQLSLFFEMVMCCYNDLKFADIEDASIEEMGKEFESHVEPSDGHDFFKNDLAGITGVDLTDHKFNHKLGYSLVERTVNGVDLSVLLLRMEDSSSWEDTIKQFIPDFALPKNDDTNLKGKTKVYAKQYHELTNKYRFPPHAVKEIQASDSWKFYSAEEQEEFIHHNVDHFNIWR